MNGIMKKMGFLTGKEKKLSDGIIKGSAFLKKEANLTILPLSSSSGSARTNYKNVAFCFVFVSPGEFTEVQA